MTITQLSNSLNVENASLEELQSLLIQAKRLVDKIEGGIDSVVVEEKEEDELKEAILTRNTLAPSLSDATEEQWKHYKEALSIIKKHNEN